MRIEVKVPVLAESITEGTLLSWRKRGGEFVRRDEILVELETDKVVLEITAPSDGVLADVSSADGAVVKSGQTLAWIDSEAKATLQTTRTEPPAPPTSTTTTTAPVKKSDNSSAPAAKIAPAARKMIEEAKLDPAQIPRQSKSDRITKEDVVSYLAEEKVTDVITPSASESVNRGRSEKRIPMTRLRARIAQRLKEAQNTAAMLTTFNEINMQPVSDIRTRHKEKFEKEYGVKLGFMSFFVKATVEALKHHPIINASIDGDDIVYHNYFDIGVAVSSPRGLVVPVLRNADVMSFFDVEHQINDYSRKAKDGKLTIEELTGGTFTISNGGVFGSLLSTPILNPPQSAILGMHKTQPRPVAENDAVVIRPMMYVALSYDHRIIDGHDAVLFLVKLKDMLEDPSRLLLQL